MKSVIGMSLLIQDQIPCAFRHKMHKKILLFHMLIEPKNTSNCTIRGVFLLGADNRT